MAAEQVNKANVIIGKQQENRKQIEQLEKILKAISSGYLASGIQHIYVRDYHIYVNEKDFENFLKIQKLQFEDKEDQLQMELENL